MEKHAYLILAHNNFYNLEKLLLMLDDERNDIFLHIDKKVRAFDTKAFTSLCKRSGVYFVKNRVSCGWGHHSLVQAELRLFAAAARRGNYRYYHLLSGADLPLVSQDVIHAFFADKTADYMECDSVDLPDNKKRISTYRYVFGRNTDRQRLYSEYADILQRKLKVDRLKRLPWPVRKGAQWVSLTNDSVRLLLKKRGIIRRFTRFSWCVDEVYKQTVLIGCGRPYVNDNLRFIDWTRSGNGHPHVFAMGDLEDLLDSSKLFARKFDENKDRQVIDRIYHHTMGKAGD